MRLYMEPYTLFDALQRLRRMIAEMEESVLQAERLYGKLKWGWEGDAALQLLEGYRQWLRTMYHLLDEGYALLWQAERALQTWEETDQRWANYWQKQLFL